MSFTVYETIVPAVTQGLNVMGDYLTQAETLERTKELPPGSVLDARLAPDMLSFGEQITVNCNKVERHVANLLRRERPTPHADDMTYPALRRRLLETDVFLERLRPEDLADAQSHTYELTPVIVRGWFGGDDYIRHLVVPDFYFHVAVAHAILRHLGAPIGNGTTWASCILKARAAIPRCEIGPPYPVAVERATVRATASTAPGGSSSGFRRSSLRLDGDREACMGESTAPELPTEVVWQLAVSPIAGSMAT